MYQLISQIKQNTAMKFSSSNTESDLRSIWFWISIIEFLIIILLIVKLRWKSSNLTFSEISNDKKRKAKSTEIDMENLMNSINISKELYKELSRACHPDRFVNSEKQKIAVEIFQEISKNKRNYKVLQELKRKAIIELEITIK